MYQTKYTLLFITILLVGVGVGVGGMGWWGGLGGLGLGWILVGVVKRALMRELGLGLGVDGKVGVRVGDVDMECIGDRINKIERRNNIVQLICKIGNIPQAHHPKFLRILKIPSNLTKITQLYCQIHHQIPLKIYCPQQYPKHKQLNQVKNQASGEGLKEKYWVVVEMGEKIREEVEGNLGIFGVGGWFFGVVWNMRQIKKQWHKIYMILKQQQMDEQSQHQINQTDQQLIRTIQLAFSRQDISTEQSNKRVKNALATINDYVNTQEPKTQLHPQPIPNSTTQQFLINHPPQPTPNDPIPTPMSTSILPQYNRQQFKSQLNLLLLNGLQQRRLQSQLNSQKQNQDRVQIEIKYDEERKEYQAVEIGKEEEGKGRMEGEGKGE